MSHVQVLSVDYSEAADKSGADQVTNGSLYSWERVGGTHTNINQCYHIVLLQAGKNVQAIRIKKLVMIKIIKIKILSIINALFRFTTQLPLIKIF